MRDRNLDLTGKKFGKLTVNNLDHLDEKNGPYWYCICDCGNGFAIVNTHNLKQGAVSSCGCLNIEGLARYALENAKENKIPHIGEKYGQLTIVDYVVNKGYKCKCDCGNEKDVWVVESELFSGHTKSCGCFRRGRLLEGENAFRRMYDAYRRNALRRGLDFPISKDDFKEITKQNCYYCGSKPSQVYKAGPKCFGDYIYNGIDRVDNTKGYSADNIVSCCSFCNHSKKNYSEEDFIEHIVNVYEFLKSKGVIENKSDEKNIS